MKFQVDSGDLKAAEVEAGENEYEEAAIKAISIYKPHLLGLLIGVRKEGVKPGDGDEVLIHTPNLMKKIELNLDYSRVKKSPEPGKSSKPSKLKLASNNGKLLVDVDDGQPSMLKTIYGKISNLIGKG